MNEDIVKKTQDTLGKIIGKKPPLTEKLLNRPPFRFLHDVLTSVIRQTGFMKGLFTEKESAAESVGSKEEKIAFLQKAIDIVVLVTGIKLSVKPSKIVAGLEAEKTNEFLQALALACGKKPDNESCVKQILSGGGGDKSSSKSKSSSRDKENHERETSADKRKHRDKDKIDSSKGKSRSKDNKESDKRREKDGDRKHRDTSRDGRRRDSSRDGRKDRESSSDGRRRETSSDGRKRESSRRDERKSDDRKDRNREEKPEPSSNENGEKEEPTGEDDASATDEEPQTNRLPRPSSAKGSRRRHREGRRPINDPDNDEEEMQKNERKKREPEPDQDMTDALPPQIADARRMARPSSARPAPPKVKRQDAVPAPTERIDSGKRVENLIVDDDGEEEEDDAFMVEEGGQQEQPVVEQAQSTAPAEDDGQHGGLVKKILESKKEFDTTQTQNKTKIEKSSAVSDATRHKEKEMVRKEVEKLRGSIQTLTRSANPLGKIMDYVQEDLHSMQKEKDMWKHENKKLQDEISTELGVTDTSIEPLKAQLSELEQAVADQLDLIAAVKHNVLRNDEKMAKMLSSIARS